MDGSGNVYVAENTNSRIASFSPSDFAGTFATFGSTGSGNGQFHGPTDIKVDSLGNVYVADQGNNRIVKLSGAVPEPTSTVLLLGSGAMLLRRLRRGAR